MAKLYVYFDGMADKFMRQGGVSRYRFWTPYGSYSRKALGNLKDALVIGCDNHRRELPGTKCSHYRVLYQRLTRKREQVLTL
jgi:hypothetical protein